MCIDHKEFHKVLTTLQLLVENTSRMESHLKEQNSRISKAETKIAAIDIARAGRLQDCPYRPTIEESARYVHAHKITRSEMRYWFSGVLITLIGIGIALYNTINL